MTQDIYKRRRGAIHIGRFGEILSVLVKFGFGDIIANLNIEKYTSLYGRFIPRTKKLETVKKQSRWERIRLTLEELGPTFIKLGQFMSNRPDILPDPLINELEKLQDSVKPFSVSKARTILEESFAVPLSEVVTDFNETPLASASIAQVHQATLKTGESVVFKIQRPRVTQIIMTDIDILFHLAALVEKRFAIARALKITQLVEEFRRLIRKELDFTIEASHIERFQRDFKDDQRTYVPKVYRNFTSKRVLTIEFIEGIKVSDIQLMKKAGLDLKTIAINGVQLILTQLFTFGFFHADPHPGNILVRTDGTICFLDFGAIGILSPTLRYHLSIVLYGLIRKDSQKIVRTLSQLAYTRITNIEQLEYDVAEFIEEYSFTLLHQVNIGDILRRFVNIITEHDIKIVPGFYLLMKTLISIEGIGTKLDPDFSITEYFEPYAKKLIKDSSHIKHLTEDLYFTLMDLSSLLKNLPFEMKEVLRIVKNGELRIQFEHQGLEPMIMRHEHLVNKLVFAIVLAALIIGSSIVIHSNIQPTFYGISFIGIVGFLLAALIGFGLLFSIIRKKKF